MAEIVYRSITQEFMHVTCSAKQSEYTCAAYKPLPLSENELDARFVEAVDYLMVNTLCRVNALLLL